MVAQWQHSNTEQWSNMLENNFFPLKNWVQFYKKKSKKNSLYLTKLRENMHNEKLKLATLKWLNTPSNDVSNQ